MDRPAPGDLADARTRSPGEAELRSILDAPGQGAPRIDDQIRAAQRDLDRLLTLLDGVMRQLSTDFDALNHLARRQSMAAAAATTARPASSAAAMAGFAAELQDRMGGIAMALQFHDIANQLAGNARRRLEHARQIASGLGGPGTPDAPAATS
jgi:hypothetical protein